MKDITTIGIDIAKNYIQIHGENAEGKRVLKKRVAREQFLSFMANVGKCLVGMEACGGSHHWAHELLGLGFEVRLMSPRRVKAFVATHKNDANDAQACAEAVRRPSMCFVPIKTKRQLEIQAIHRVRTLYIKQRISLTNNMRGILLEKGIGIAIAKGKSAFVKKLRELLAVDNESLTGSMKEVFGNLYEDMKRLEEAIEGYTTSLEKLAQEDECCRRLSTLPGVGPLSASAVVAKIGNGSEFQQGRELSAYLGLVPQQHSSGEKQRLLGISKHGDRYIRQLLIHGGRSALYAAMRKNKTTGLFEKQDAHSQWMRTLAERVGINKASVAVANKNARVIVALLKHQTSFQAALAH